MIRRTIEIENNEVLDLTMTLIIGMRTEDGLIVAADGLTGHGFASLDLPVTVTTDFDKIRLASSSVVYALAGGKVNWTQKLHAIIGSLLQQNPEAPLGDIANTISSVLPSLYSDGLDDPEFGLNILIAGYTNDPSKKRIFAIFRQEGENQEWKVGSWDEVQNWSCIGTENTRSNDYIKERSGDKTLTKEEAINLLKEAMADTAEHNPNEVGGHTSVYEVTNDGARKIE